MRGVALTDLDADGDQDVVASLNPTQGSADSPRIVWYENDGNEQYVRQTLVVNGLSGSLASYTFTKIVPADLNEDGRMDLLVQVGFPGSVFWFENVPQGFFFHHNLAGGDIRDFQLADIDEDNDLDIVAVAFDQLLCYKNNGSEEFTWSFLADTLGPTSVVVADIDGDTHLDAVVSSEQQDTIQWYENIGAPPFTQHAVATSLDGASFLNAADMDGDNDIDLLSTARFGGQVTWHENNGSGAFASHLVSTLTTPRRVIASDIDDDGETDIVAISQSGGTQWFKNDGEQAFTSHLIDSIPATLLAVGDIDGDSAIDVLSTFLTASPSIELAWQKNDGQGNFSSRGIAFSTDLPRGVITADLDGDSDVDVVSTSYLDDTIAWYENVNAAFPVRHMVTTAVNGPWGVHAADVDQDGDVDLLSASRMDDQIAWFENDGGGNFVFHAVATDADRATTVFAADIDGDGDVDLLSGSATDNRIAWYENNGQQGFTTHTITTSAPNVRWVRSADLDRDGDMDIVSASTTDNRIAWYENNGAEAFTPYTISTFGPAPQSVATVDLDRDGDVDLVASSASGGGIFWLKNDGTQNFTFHSIGNALSARAAIPVDLDRDGDWDVVSTSYGDDRVTWYENNGSQAFTSRIIDSYADGGFSVVAADLDADGDPDLVASSSLNDRIAWYQNGDTVTDTAAPHVTSSMFLYKPALNRLQLTFSEDVSGSLTLADLQLTQLGGGPVGGITFHSYDPLIHTATFILPADLVDGNYRVSLAPGGVTDRSGNAVPSNYSFDFYVLAGDANRDRKVDVQDLIALAGNWLGTGKDFADGDFNHDGVVNQTDLGILAVHWQQRVELPPPPAAPVLTTARRPATRTPVRIIQTLEPPAK